MKISDKKVRVFIDGVDWQHELGSAMGGNMVYPSKKDAEISSPCTEDCGIVECEVSLVKWVKPQNTNWPNAKSFAELEAEEKKIGKKALKLKHLENQRKYLEKKLDMIYNKIEEVENEKD